VEGFSVTPLEDLLAKFPEEGDSGVSCVVSNMTTYNLYHQVYQNKYWEFRLSGILTAGQYAMRHVNSCLRELWIAFTDITPTAFAKGGTGWISGGQASSIGGRISYTYDAGRTISVTTPAGITSVGVIVNPTSTGATLVTIDGDNTLADLLPTAQSLVDSTALPDTVLIANGGLLNPTDRIFGVPYTDEIDNVLGVDPLSGHVKIFTRSLTAGVHTVTLTVMPYGGDPAMLIQSVIATGTGITMTSCLTYGAPAFLALLDIDTETCVWEISYSFQPTGATAKEWLGHEGQALCKVIPVVTVDGAEKTLASGDSYAGVVKVTMQHSIRHSETGANEQGTIDFAYTMGSDGLTIEHDIKWSTSGVAQGYPCMMSVIPAVFDRFGALDAVADSDLPTSNNTRYLNGISQAEYCWDIDGNIAALFYIPDLVVTVENWAKSGASKFFWSDSRKCYANRFGDVDEAYTNITEWLSKANYRIAWFPGGANAALAK
jgi:hypothetical protein